MKPKILFSFIALLLCSCATQRSKNCSIEGSSIGCGTTILKLLVNPERYQNKLISIIGYVTKMHGSLVLQPVRSHDESVALGYVALNFKEKFDKKVYMNEFYVVTGFFDEVTMTLTANNVEIMPPIDSGH